MLVLKEIHATSTTLAVVTEDEVVAVVALEGKVASPKIGSNIKAIPMERHGTIISSLQSIPHSHHTFDIQRIIPTR